MQRRHVELRDRIIVALDFERPELAREMVLRCESKIGFYKVGLELFMADWFHTVDWLIARGHRVMLDLKFFDIPETVKRAVHRVNDRGVSLFTVHGDRTIIEAAVAARGDMKVLAVTVLTSFSDDDLRDYGFAGTTAELVRRRADMAIALGCDGIVSSGREAEMVRQRHGGTPLIVTPGIRMLSPTETAVDDQKRVMTPARAIAAGADHLVVGRPITRAPDPLAVISGMQDDLAAVLDGNHEGSI